MLSLFFLLYSTLYCNVVAAPVIASLEASSLLPRHTDSINDNPRKRLEIIWSCVATILASSWVAVHPNLPHPDDSKMKKTLRRMELMFWAIITPEFIIYWAARQWYGAKRMEKEFPTLLSAAGLDTDSSDHLVGEGCCMIHIAQKMAESQPNAQRRHSNSSIQSITGQEFKWTKTHGFFFQMGGFMVHENGKKKYIPFWRDLAAHHVKGQIDLSGVTEEIINDRSKADGFAKGLALLQTCWFITQCIARFLDKNLVLTELELVTAALASLSLVMYGLWWNKPFNAEIPIIFTISETRYSLQTDVFQIHSRAEKSTIVELKDALYQCKNILHRIQDIVREDGGGEWTNPLYRNAANGVPTFYSIGDTSYLDDLNLRLPCFFIAVLFGAVHCVGWSTKIQFSSHIASLLWRISSGVITGSPIVWGLYFIFLYGRSDECPRDSTLNEISRRLLKPFKYISVFTIPLYMASRIILLVLAFVELRNIAPGALATLGWANVVPFIH